jgi:hypothetical protein
MDPGVSGLLCSGVFEVDAFSAAMLTRIGGNVGSGPPVSMTDDELRVQCISTTAG